MSHCCGIYPRSALTVLNAALDPAQLVATYTHDSTLIVATSANDLAFLVVVSSIDLSLLVVAPSRYLAVLIFVVVYTSTSIHPRLNSHCGDRCHFLRYLPTTWLSLLCRVPIFS